MLQAPFELFHREHAYGNAFEASSPPSSPYAVDSSPPSSPLNDPFLLSDSDEEPDAMVAKSICGEPASSNASPSSPSRKGKGKLLSGLDTSPAHPFSASTRATKRPPTYSKDSTRPKVKRQRGEVDEHWNVFGIPHRAGVHERDRYIQSFVPSVATPPYSLRKTDGDGTAEGLVSPSQDSEHSLWEETIAQAVDAAECKIDLRCVSPLKNFSEVESQLLNSGHGLTYIPPKIADLSKLVVIRDPANSAREPTPRRTCSKSTNSIVFGAGKLGHREDEIHLFLGRNSITSLPNELFNLDALVVLSLRESQALVARFI